MLYSQALPRDRSNILVVPDCAPLSTRDKRTISIGDSKAGPETAHESSPTPHQPETDFACSMWMRFI